MATDIRHPKLFNLLYISGHTMHWGFTVSGGFSRSFFETTGLSGQKDELGFVTTGKLHSVRLAFAGNAFAPGSPASEVYNVLMNKHAGMVWERTKDILHGEYGVRGKGNNACLLYQLGFLSHLSGTQPLCGYLYDIFQFIFLRCDGSDPLWARISRCERALHPGLQPARASKRVVIFIVF
jgi:hypothetical protein